MTYMEADDFLPTLSGAVIKDAEVTSDGMHLRFDDGRVLVLSGQFVVGMYRQEATH